MDSGYKLSVNVEQNVKTWSRKERMRLSPPEREETTESWLLELVVRSSKEDYIIHVNLFFTLASIHRDQCGSGITSVKDQTTSINCMNSPAKELLTETISQPEHQAI